MVHSRFSLKQSCTSMVSPSRWAERATAEAEYVDVFSSGAEEGYSPMTIEVYHSMATPSRRPHLPKEVREQ
jgi:hypothetical protein